jgi:hypothetical protein
MRAKIPLKAKPVEQVNTFLIFWTYDKAKFFLRKTKESSKKTTEEGHNEFSRF